MMSVQEHNPFKVGDKVSLKQSSYDFNPRLWDAYRGYEYSFVTAVDGNKITTSEDKFFSHYTHFDFYKEGKDMNQQTQQKTKRVPFTHELWESGNKTANVYYLATQRQLCGLVCFEQVNNPYKYAGYAKDNDCIYVCSEDEMFLEIPVTTKRIPFNPELKDAKVFIKRGNCLVKEWHLFSNEAVAVLPKSSRLLSAKDKSELEMEIEEDV